MEQDVLKKISREIYRRFPEVKGKKPKVQLQRTSKNRTSSQPVTYLLIYSGSGKTATSVDLLRIVRVVATEDGEVLKITTSR